MIKSFEKSIDIKDIVAFQASSKYIAAYVYDGSSKGEYLVTEATLLGVDHKAVTIKLLHAAYPEFLEVRRGYLVRPEAITFEPNWALGCVAVKVANAPNVQISTRLYEKVRRRLSVIKAKLEFAEIQEEKPTVKPKQEWTHRNGIAYEVLLLTNENADEANRATYPVTVVYRNIQNGLTWSRPLSAWHRSFTLTKPA